MAHALNWPDQPNGRTVVSPDGWKLILYDSNENMLFNRHHDPLEMHNLYGSSEHKDVVKRLRAHLEDWQRQSMTRSECLSRTSLPDLWTDLTAGGMTHP